MTTTIYDIDHTQVRGSFAASVVFRSTALGAIDHVGRTR